MFGASFPGNGWLFPRRFLATAMFSALLAAFAQVAAAGPHDHHSGLKADATPAQARPPAPGLPEDAAAKLASANNATGESLFLQLDRARTGNVLVAPASFVSSLELLSQGAAAPSDADFASALALDRAGIPPGQLVAAHAALQRALDSQGLEFARINAMWTAPHLPVTPNFREAASGFHAEIDRLDFTRPDSADKINAFASRATRGKIPQLLDTLPGNTQFVMVNALYFKGAWQNRFDKANTRLRPFKRPSGGTVERPTMQARGTFRYLENDELKAVALPFSDTRFELVLILPGEGRRWQAGWSAVLESARFNPRPGKLVTPRLKLSSAQDLLDPLRQAGFAKVLDAKANYSALSTSPLEIGRIQHGVFLEMDEEGAEAAAATAIMATRSAGPDNEEFNLVLDRPFYLLLRERLTGAIILMGWVADPGET